ncbi:DUF427 domain-containing protein [Nakamurella flavida]|uniref:DUF427 domain-containing protein n=1 Tax=Nakamurella flavida TaxID=363630 RepID=A0A938YJN0_9ACTN|nr:DUF427 domain-containing protein [Nakamurella flavida]MBM9476364.1 DUF427 domain-containing protein [Nakamurella flavida]MDP9779536.1 uncharacterized protein (DUF427 family) [Nakamurella flavida]
MATATWNGVVIAESDATEIVEGNHYFPADSVRQDVLVPSATTTVCPWKGTASYWTLSVDGEQNTDAAWFYPEPKEAAAQIAGHVAFWKGVTVTD